MNMKLIVHNGSAAVERFNGGGVVVIPSTYNNLPVTEIMDYAFAGTAVQAVVIPPSVHTIGIGAFENCRILQSVQTTEKKIRKKIIIDEENGFPANDKEEFSIFSKNLRQISDNAFRRTALRNIRFLSKSMEFGESVFEDCNVLNSVEFENCRDLNLGRRIFMSSSIMRFSALKAVLGPIPEYAFAYCRRLLYVHALVSAVKYRGFYQCGCLVEFYPFEPMLYVEKEAFVGCKCLSRPECIFHDAMIPEPSTVEDTEDHSKRTEEERMNTERMNTLENLEANELDALLQELMLDDEQEDELIGNTVDSASSDKEKAHEGQDVMFAEQGCDWKTAASVLFQTQILQTDYLSKPLNGTFIGHLKKTEDGYRWKLVSPPECSGIWLALCPGQENVEKVLEYLLRKHQISAMLAGKQNGQYFNVGLFAPSPCSPKEEALPPEVYEKMIQYGKRTVLNNRTGEQTKPLFTMTQQGEYEAFIEVCGEKLPPWVLRAFQKNAKIINDKYRSSSDIRHARRAQEMLMNIDWSPRLSEVPSAKAVRESLDDTFFGLDEVKTRIEEIMSQIHRSKAMPKWGILLNGPAGTGKTTIAKAIASVLRLPLIDVDISTLGSSTDEVSGSSRIYENARSGRILEKMFEVRSSTAVLLLNELDKIEYGKAAASKSDVLLTILDKTGFYENCLDEVVPTDNLLCIATCNDISKISAPMRDRFMVVDLPGYTSTEKKHIFRDYVMPRVMECYRVTPEQMEVSEEALNLLIQDYFLDPGARELEQTAQRLVGNYLKDSEGVEAKKVYTEQDICVLFGPSKKYIRNIVNHPGQVMSAFYHDGKAHFFVVEASILPGCGKMESLDMVNEHQAAYCKAAYICARNTINSDSFDFSKHDVTVFIPQPTPDGRENYVGLACFAAICSAVMHRELNNNEICMIGGCDLNGSLYFDEKDLRPLLAAMQERNVKTLFAPMGTSDLFRDCGGDSFDLKIIEAPDAATLFSLAIARGGC